MNVPDEITGSTIPIHPDVADDLAAMQAQVDESAIIVEVASKEPYEEDEPEVYGIAFPKTMLPLDAMSGTWTADEIKDLEGGTDEVFVRVWLYGPTGPGKKED